MRYYADLQYNTRTGEWQVGTNVRVPEALVGKFLHSQSKSLIDESPKQRHLVYKIYIEYEDIDDLFTCTYNCGNKELRAELLMHFIATRGMV